MIFILKIIAVVLATVILLWFVYGACLVIVDLIEIVDREWTANRDQLDRIEWKLDALKKEGK